MWDIAFPARFRMWSSHIRCQLDKTESFQRMLPLSPRGHVTGRYRMFHRVRPTNRPLDLPLPRRLVLVWRSPSAHATSLSHPLTRFLRRRLATNSVEVPKLPPSRQTGKGLLPFRRTSRTFQSRHPSGRHLSLTLVESPPTNRSARLPCFSGWLLDCLAEPRSKNDAPI